LQGYSVKSTRTWRRARRSSPIWLLDEGGAGVRVGESCCPSLSEARSVRPHPVVSPAGAHGDTSIDRLRAEIRYTERGHREPFPRWHLPRPTRTRDALVHAITSCFPGTGRLEPSDSSTRCGRTTTPARSGGSSSNITPAGSSTLPRSMRHSARHAPGSSSNWRKHETGEAGSFRGVPTSF
jgi:hypothetical protein